ncbi:uncharacterized protein LOC134683731 [Mytilus trossulus]|uniref:uncharacterized protein LOC134683731 n=1 Tax=Mytilus trossulus TaxID=6551 RepID=UPI0030067D4C
MTSNWSVCGVCDYRHITKPSIVWCSECDEGLCEECNEHHGISKGTRNHGTVCITEYKKLPNKVLQLVLSCDKHNEKYQIFCKKHDCPCCKKCIVETHNDCKDLTDIDDILRDIKSSNAFAEIVLSLSEVAKNFKRLRTNWEENLASLGKKIREIEKAVQETRAKITQHLDKLQDEMLKELKKRENEESNKIRIILKSLMDKEHKITEHQTNIANIKQYASELQAFLALKHIEKEVAANELYIQSMIKSDGANQIEMSWKPNTFLLSAIKKFGDVVVTENLCKIPILKQKDKQAQMMVTVTPITIDNLKPVLLQSFDAKLRFIAGCTLLPDCRMVFACSAYKMIKILKPDGSPEFEIREFGPVFDLALIDDNSVAVTSGYFKDCLQINLIDLKTKKVNKPLTVNTVNTGVAYIEDKLIYCSGKDGIQIISLNDASIDNVSKTSIPDNSYVAVFRDNIFYTDCNDNSVTCIGFQGNVKWEFKNENVLNAPFGISVDRDGNVYVVGENSNNVVVISPNGRNYKQVLTSENGLKEPVVVHIDRSSCKMLVANRKGKAILYSLI